MKLFGLDIPEIVSSALSGNLLPVKIHRPAQTEYDPIEDAEVVTVQSRTFESEGVIDTYSEFMVAQGMVTEKHRKVIVLAKPLDGTPRLGDTIEIEGERLTIVGKPERDPSGAIWTIKGEY